MSKSEGSSGERKALGSFLEDGTACGKAGWYAQGVQASNDEESFVQVFVYPVTDLMYI